MFNIGPQELLLILLVALIVVGPRRLPELSRSIGKGLRELRKAQDEVRKTITLNLDESEPTSPGRGRGPSAPSAETGAAAAAQPSVRGRRRGHRPDARRGLAEIRRTRQEIQRSFRVDLSDKPRATAGPRLEGRRRLSHRRGRARARTAHPKSRPRPTPCRSAERIPGPRPSRNRPGSPSARCG